jgi:NAD(P)-dependent dehydrogenase (short-subunit alcohol dehydrogenase family)
MEVFRVNLISAFLITKEGIRLMKSQGGNIIHMVSSSAKSISSKKAPYGMAKSALVTMIQYVATETAKHNIRVNGISPTYVFTPRHQKEIKKKSQNKKLERKDLEAKMVDAQLLKKKLFSEDLIPVVELLMKTEIITGQIYNVTLGEVLSY